MSAEEFWYFFDGYPYEEFESAAVLNYLKSSKAFTLKNVTSNEEKEFFRNRNQQIFDNPSIIRVGLCFICFEIIDHVLDSLETLNIDLILEKIEVASNENGDIDSDSDDDIDGRTALINRVTIKIAKIAAEFNRPELFMAMKRLRNGNYFPVHFFKDIYFENDIKTFSDELLHCLAERNPSDKLEKSIFPFRMEILRRKQDHLRCLEDLNMFDFCSHKFVALAKFFPIETFRDQLGAHKDSYTVIIKDIIEYLDDPVPFVHEVMVIRKSKSRSSVLPGIVSSSQFSIPISTSDLASQSDILADFKLITKLVEPQKAHIISDLSIYPAFYVSYDFYRISQMDLEFRRRFRHPEAEQLRLNCRIGFFDYFDNFHTKIFLLAHEIVDFFRLFGLEFGNFEINPEEFGSRVSRDYSVKELRAMSSGALDMILVNTPP